MRKYVCIKPSNGATGLESYVPNQEYDCEAQESDHYRIWPAGFLAGYFETCAAGVFQKYFRLIDT